MGSMFPALAGMNRRTSNYLSICLNVPRTRGDEPNADQALALMAICSPHSRG